MDESKDRLELTELDKIATSPCEQWLQDKGFIDYMINRIKFGEFKTTDAHRRSVMECLDSNWLTMGERVKLLEEKYKGLFGYKYAAALNSGTSADAACCMALHDGFDARAGNLIIAPALTFVATWNAIRAAQFEVWPVDIDIESLNIDVDKISICDDTVAIMPVNLMGVPAKLDKIQEIAYNRYKKKRLPIIVDNCEAYSAKLNGKYSLEYADFETCSMFNAHMVFSVEGSIVCTKDESLDKLIRSIRSHGRPHGDYFQHDNYGLNFKQTDLHASIGLVEIENFWDIQKKRKHNLTRLIDGTKKYRDLAYFNYQPENGEIVGHGFSIVLKDKSNAQPLKDWLDKYTIQWKRNFQAISQCKAFSHLGYKIGQFPIAEYVADYGLHIGCHQYLSEDDIEYIIWVLDSFFKNV